MEISLRSGAKILKDDPLTLKTSQTRLKDSIQGLLFENSAIPVTIGACTDCSSPIVDVSFPQRISAGCAASQPPRAVFDGSLTVDRSGRVLTYSWTVGLNGSIAHCFRKSTDSQSYTDCPILKAIIDAQSYDLDLLFAFLIICILDRL